MTPETLLADLADVVRGQLGDCPNAMSDTACAAAILEHLDSLAMIRWAWEHSCTHLHRYGHGPGGLICMRRKGHDGTHRQGETTW